MNRRSTAVRDGRDGRRAGRPRRAVLLVTFALLAAAAAPSDAGYRAGGLTIWSIAGNGVPCADAASDCGDGPSALDAFLNGPGGIAVGADGAVFVADTGGHKVRRVTTAGVITTVAGDGEACADPAAPCGDGGPGVLGRLNAPRGLALTADGTLLIADSLNHRIRALGTDGTLRTVAGSGTPCADAMTACGDGDPATQAALREPAGVAVGSSGDMLIADTGDRRIRRVHDGVITTLAGTGAPCAPGCGDGGPAAGARFDAPAGLALTDAGHLLVADAGAHRVRRITPAGSTSSVTGDGTPCAGPELPCGDGGDPQDGKLTAPLGVAALGDAILIADSGANRVRRVGSVLSTIAGTGSACALPPACGDGGAATLATLSAPAAIAVDAAGDLVVADTGAHLVRWLTGPAPRAPGAPPLPAPTTPPATPAGQRVLAVENAPSPKAKATRRATVVRCSGRRCRVAGADAALTARLRRQARSASGGDRAVVELRRGGRRWARGAGRTLAQALTLLPERQIRAGRYRLRITQTDARGERRRDRIVRLR